MKLKDQVAIVTGGGTGIGCGICRCLAREGAAIVVAQRRLEKAQAMADTLNNDGYRAVAISVDVSRRDQVKRLIEKTVSELGRIDILVNNAAITGQPALQPFMDQSDDFWNKVIAINLTGAFYCAQEAAKVMIAQNHGGSIINISSVAGTAAQENASAYCASKAGMEGMTKVAALELATHGIRVNAVAPGDINTEASADVESFVKRSGGSGRFLRYTPLDRRGSGDEIGHVVTFLASDQASFVTGCTWLVDGGFLAY